MSSDDLEQLDSHFKFGENWSDFSQGITKKHIQEARQSFITLVGTDDLSQQRFLDIGCGSGLFSLAASSLNAEHVLSTDIDPNSVKTTQHVLEQFATHKNYACQQISVFDLDPKTQGTFDIVYSWGVLHHTGSMYKAITHAASMVAPNGKLVIALYRKTKLCGWWKFEKRLYSRAPKFIQALLRYPFAGLLLLAYCAKGKTPRKLFNEYKEKRGMSFMHDIHDWLGGYPYESITPHELHQFAAQIGFKVEREYTRPPGMEALFGSGCDEYVLKRI
ncbi:MAG: SAM-dependent methyltransferase [Coxiella sp. (in: Bacteria)]|nr:MAG: SAM-dependent methyltransferase [Coxiella sp. (in: g-proteobacteria)]